MTMLRMLELELLHSLTQMDPRAVIDLQRRILLLHQRQRMRIVGGRHERGITGPINVGTHSLP